MKRLAIAVCAVSMLSACAEGPSRNVWTGAAAGAILGAGAGTLAGGDDGRNAAIGAAVGAIAGAARCAGAPPARAAREGGAQMTDKMTE